jgi:hypothetical protein
VTKEDRQALRIAARAALLATSMKTSDRHAVLACDWQLQTSNSFRRIGTQGRGDGDVLCATTHPVDHHPDLLAPSGVLDYIVAAQPRVVLELLDYIDKIEQESVHMIESHVACAVLPQERAMLMRIRDSIYAIVAAKKAEKVEKP